MKMKNVLFICSQNRLRSPTAEKIFSNNTGGYNVRSAGMDKEAGIPVTQELINWADWIFVMEKSHKNKLLKKFKRNLIMQRIVVLGIPDEYEYMDNALIDLLRMKLGEFFSKA